MREFTILNGKTKMGCACGLIMGSNGCTTLMENPLIGGFVEKQHEKKVRRGAAKRLRA
jgi:hypothetical protein